MRGGAPPGAPLFTTARRPETIPPISALRLKPSLLSNSRFVTVSSSVASVDGSAVLVSPTSVVSVSFTPPSNCSGTCTFLHRIRRQVFFNVFVEEPHSPDDRAFDFQQRSLYLFRFLLPEAVRWRYRIQNIARTVPRSL